MKPICSKQSDKWLIEGALKYNMSKSILLLILVSHRTHIKGQHSRENSIVMSLNLEDGRVAQNYTKCGFVISCSKERIFLGNLGVLGRNYRYIEMDHTRTTIVQGYKFGCTSTALTGQNRNIALQCNLKDTKNNLIWFTAFRGG